MREFDFQIYGHELDEYCTTLINKYGEGSKVVSVLDSEYERLIKTSHRYTDQLNAIRKFLWEHHFEKEISEIDEIFLEKMNKKFPREKPISMIKRWEKDQLIFKVSKRNP